MTPYETIYQYIQDDVDRPDKADIINRRIQRALLYYHRFEKWQKDLIEQVYIFEQAETMASNLYPPVGSQALFMTSLQPVDRLYIQKLDKRVLTRFRTILYMNKWSSVDRFGLGITDPDTGVQGTTAAGDITERSPDSMFDAYGGQVSDVFYEAGDYLNIKSSTPLSQLYLGYFADPVLEPVVNIYSWIAKDYSSLITCAVKVRMFGDMGKMEEQKSAAAELKIEHDSLIANNIKLSARK